MVQGKVDPHRDPHAEMRGKGKKGAERKHQDALLRSKSRRASNDHLVVMFNCSNGISFDTKEEEA